MGVKNIIVLGSVAIGAVAGVLATGAGASSATGLDFALTLEAQQPMSPTGLTLHVIYKNPSDPNGKPSPLRRSIVEAPAGAVFDGQAVPVCTASDGQLMADGAGACPLGSRVGAGKVSLITGFGPAVDPFMVDAVLFNAGNGVTELFSDHRSGARISVGHARFTAPNTLTEMPTPNPGGPPDGESAVREISFRFNELLGPAGKAFITTPPSCPATGRWASKITATVADGHTYTATSTTPCRPVAIATARPGPSRPPAIRIRVFPRHVRTGSSARIRVRLRAATELCKRSVTVQINGRHTITDAHGRASVRVRFPAPGTYSLKATKHGCADGHARVIAHTRKPPTGRSLYRATPPTAEH